ncbi:hypothetical protein ACH5Y9_01255 [Methylomonas sp. BW4-1]|uniref:hypothetical protein n=1 Tax=Methylomonas sp. BW4-1 TaxID=3376685 RepID=UPI0040438B37
MNLPVHYKSDLTHERLTVIASILLEEYYNTLDDLSSDYDSPYTWGCTAFGRQKNRIISLALAGNYPWLKVLNSGNDLVFAIGSVSCRFSSDNPENPKKNATLTVNRYQQPLFDDAENGEPCRFCFVLDKGYNEDIEPRIVFLGFDASGAIKCQWESDDVRTLHSVAPVTTPSAVQISKPTVTPKRPSSDGIVGRAGEQ